jgi:flagellar biogenesis protein FliO
MDSPMWQWFAATIAVIALVLILAHGVRFLLDRSRSSRGPVTQVGAWRIAPDASVRAVRVLGHVHLVYERGRESMLLETLDADRLPELGPAQSTSGPFELLRGRRASAGPVSKVARG